MKKEFGYLLKGLLVIMLPGLSSPATADCDDDREPGMDWSGCRKMHKMLDEEDFTGSQFNSANLSSSNLKESDFTRASMIKIDLTRAKLDRATVRKNRFIKISGLSCKLRKSPF